MNDMRKMYKLCLSIVALFCTAVYSDVAAQYRIIGFEGMDTVELGIAEQKSGRFVLPKSIAKYTKVELVPVSPTYTEIERHLRQLQKAYIDKSVETITAERDYIAEKLDFASLYYSPLYADYLFNWLGSYNLTSTSTIDFEQRFTEDAVRTIARLMLRDEKQIAQNLAKDLAIFTYRYNFYSAAREIIDYMQNVDKDFVAKHKDLKYAVDFDLFKTHTAAPPIAGLAAQQYGNCLIVFFDSDNVRSTAEVDKIIGLYDKIKQRGLRVISIAADRDMDKYSQYAAKLPWTDKLCDSYGIKGENFENYGVFDLPAIFMTDADGNIVVAGSDLNKILK